MKPMLDWPGLLRLGLAGLGLRPAEFWALTPAELLMMLGADLGEAPLGRRQLAALSARFPDAAKTAAKTTERHEA